MHGTEPVPAPRNSRIELRIIPLRNAIRANRSGLHQHPSHTPSRPTREQSLEIPEKDIVTLLVGERGCNPIELDQETPETCVVSIVIEPMSLWNDVGQRIEKPGPVRSHSPLRRRCRRSTPRACSRQRRSSNARGRTANRPVPGGSTSLSTGVILIHRSLANQPEIAEAHFLLNS